MHGSIQTKKGHYYAVLSYMAQDGKYRYKWVSTGLSLRGNKKKAEAMLTDLIKEYSYLELDNSKVTTDPLFADYIREWLQHKKGQVQQSTWEGYESYINLHMIPYFKALNLTVKQVTTQHIKDYYDSRLTCSYAPHKTGLSARSIQRTQPRASAVGAHILCWMKSGRYFWILGRSRNRTVNSSEIPTSNQAMSLFGVMENRSDLII